MSSWSFSATAVLALLLIATVLVAGQEPSVQIEMTESHAKAGSEVTIVCRTENLGDNLVSLVKKFSIGGIDINVPIMEGTKLMPLAESTGRYSLAPTPLSAGTILHRVLITNVTAEDSGPYSCEIRNTNEKSERVFSVYHQVQELRFQNITMDHSFGVHLENESNEIDLDCSAHGSIPAADVEIYVGDVQISDANTKRTTNARAQCNGDIPSCLVFETFSKNTIVHNYKLSYKDDKKALKCVANVVNSGLPAREASIRLSVSYSPKFNCHKKQVARLHDGSYKLSCEVMSNPANPDFVWGFMWGGAKQNLTNNQETTDGEIKAGQTPLDNGNMEVYLLIKKVSMRHFMNYSLTSTNSLGSNTTNIELAQDETGNGAATNSISAIMVTSFVLLRQWL